MMWFFYLLLHLLHIFLYLITFATLTFYIQCDNDDKDVYDEAALKLRSTSDMITIVM